MKVVELPIDHLHPHPANCNVMTRENRAKLKKHIQRTDRYPPVIVRPLPSGQHQILDGQHRVEVMRDLDRETVRCIVWDVDDDEALLLLATLNRLEGQDDPRKRASLLATLSERMSLENLAKRLPEHVQDIERLLRLTEPPPRPRPPLPVDQMPVAVHFFLLPYQRRCLEQTLKRIGGSREDALMALVTTHQHHTETNVCPNTSVPDAANG